MIVRYVEQIPIDRFRCTEEERTVNIERTFENVSFLYGYKNLFEIISIDKDMIISPKLKKDKQEFIDAYRAAYGETKKKAVAVYKNAKQSYIDLVIKGYKNDARKAFADD